MRQSPLQPALSRESIVDAAIELVDRAGLEALTMRALARQLDVGTMTLYGYFRDKRELVDAMVDALAERAPVPALRGSWRERLAELMAYLHRSLAAYPQLARLRVAQPIVTPGAFRFTETAIAVLRGAGFDAAPAAQHFRTLFLYTFGVAVLSPADQAAEHRRRSAGALAALPPDEYPTLSGQLLEMLDSLDPEAQFRHGLELILDGIEASLPATD
jgi:AcrR family transcriptional regulator